MVKIMNIENLLVLIKENPNLPIKCMVDSEIVPDDYYAWYLADLDISDAHVDYYWNDTAHERVWIKSWDADDVWDFFEETCDTWEDECEGRTPAQCNAIAEDWIENLPWVKAIMVRIMLPEV